MRKIPIKVYEEIKGDVFASDYVNDVTLNVVTCVELTNEDTRLYAVYTICN